ncbi:MAG: glycoside hydrolase family 3 C-terminal domain-containing protein [Candidatus Azobacteroides sp.]|nr:glycoside hydrolase family 3 C-terminal domain-containing protein [Candidatus Azobacteroides sp.]
MKRNLILFFIVVFAVIPAYTQKSNIIYKQKDAPVEERIKDLLSRMTLEEKIYQLNQYTIGENTNVNNIGEVTKSIPSKIGSLIYFSADPVRRNTIQKKAMEESRLGIPILFGFDIIHGFRVVYPIPLAQACSWNPELVKSAAEFAAKESKLSGVDWTFSPMIDIGLDPRWGRVAESYGEDPYTNAVFGVATVEGYQGTDLSSPYSVAACLKHYVAYGMSEGGRDYRASNVSQQSLWETYLPPYQACIEAGAATVMSSFNDISGIPATANHYMLTEILKQKWQYDGFVVSDWNAVSQLIHQGVAKDGKEAALKSIMAGLDMDMKDNIFLENLADLIEEKKVPVERIDDAVTRILRVKFRLGLFDNPYTNIVDEKDRYLKNEDILLAQKLAEESMVLLKNKENTLPLPSPVKEIAVVGPMAKDKSNMLGSWSYHGKEEEVESIYEGLEKEFGKNVRLNYAKGCDFDGTDESLFAEAVHIAQHSEAVIICLGELKTWSGENASRSTISLPVIQEKLVSELKKTGKPLILILSNGRPLELARLEPLADAIVEIWQPGIAGGTPLAGILSGRINPSGRLAITFPYTTGQIPMYYNMRPSSRPFREMGNYQDIPNDPLYWLGYGLSYTDYEYGKATLSSEKISKDQKLKVEVAVTNTGDRKGSETVFWYINDPVSTISRPVKELKHFEKKELNPGEKKVFVFEIDPHKDLSYVDSNGDRFLEAGDYYVMVNDQKLKFELTE